MRAVSPRIRSAAQSVATYAAILFAALFLCPEASMRLTPLVIPSGPVRHWLSARGFRALGDEYAFLNLRVPDYVVAFLGGAILGTREFIVEKLQPIIRNTGPSMSPFNAWVLLKGMETLGLRIDRHCANAARVAAALAAHPAIGRVLYPGRPDHPQHKLAARQMSNFGGVVTFDVKAGKWAAFETLNRLRLIDISNNLGDSKSMVTHPATTTHMRIGAEERAKLGIGDGTVRISVGLEDVEDVIADLVQALG